jgi:hypothetical protein
MDASWELCAAATKAFRSAEEAKPDNAERACTPVATAGSGAVATGVMASR